MLHIINALGSRNTKHVNVCLLIKVYNMISVLFHMKWHHEKIPQIFSIEEKPWHGQKQKKMMKEANKNEDKQKLISLFFYLLFLN